MRETIDRELNSRETDGVAVRLFWRGEASTYVTVDDSKLNQFHSVEVPDPSLAGEVFRHPFAYIAEAGGLAMAGSKDYLPHNAD